jgi:hypothetical protein
MNFYRTRATVPDEGEVVLVSLYWPNGKHRGYVLAYYNHAEGWWEDSDGRDYVWRQAEGALWSYVPSAPEHLDDVPAERLNRMMEVANA